MAKGEAVPVLDAALGTWDGRRSYGMRQSRLGRSWRWGTAARWDVGKGTDGEW